MKLMQKAFTYAISLLLIYSIMSAAIVSIYSENVIKEQAYDLLTTATKAKANNVESLLHEYEQAVLSLSIVPGLVNSVNNSMDYDERISEAMLQANSSLQMLHAIDKIRLADLNGTIIACAGPLSINTSLNSSILYTYAFNSSAVISMHICEPNYAPTIVIAAPLKINNVTSGFIILNFNAELELYEILTEREGLGATGETYLVNSDKLMISPSRFVNDSAFNLEIDTEIINMWHEYITDIDDSHYEHHPDYEEHEIMIYEDYLGNEVLGTHEHIEEMDWILVAEMNSAEAFQPYSKMMIYIFMVTIFIIISGGMVIFATIRVFTDPILEMKEGTAEIMKGNLDHRFNVTSGDELGDLAISMNEMANQIKISWSDMEKYNKELEKEVQERTEELNKKMKASERFRIATLNMLEDISETKKNLESSEKLYSSVVNTSMDGIMIIQNKEIRFVNRSLSETLGYIETELHGSTIDSIFGSEISKIIIKFNEEVMLGESGTDVYDTVLKSKNKDEIPVEVRTGVMQFEDKDATICFVRDLRKTVKLEYGIAEALTRLQQSERRREEFIDMAAHELRTPLTAIKAYVELMEYGQMGKFDEEEITHIQMLGDSVERLNGQITGMLDASKVNAGKLKLVKESVNLREITKQVIADLSSLISIKSLKMDIKSDGDCLASADLDLITKVFMNLISNAIKYTPDNGIIEVKILKEDNQLHVLIKDSGIGISKKDLPNVFERFFIGDRSLTREHSQLGLGLAVTKAIIDSHNGKVWAESEEQKGSTFHFTLPVKESEI